MDHMKEKSLTILIDMGGTNVKLAYADSSLKISRIISFKSDRIKSNPEKLYPTICDALWRKFEMHNSWIKEFRVCMPGVIQNNRVVNSYEFASYEGIDMIRLFDGRLTKLRNDAYTAAKGVYNFYGTGIKYPAAVLTLGTGVGYASIKDGKVKEDGDLVSKWMIHPFKHEGFLPVNFHSYIGSAGINQMGLSEQYRPSIRYTWRVLKALATLHNTTKHPARTYVLLGGNSKRIRISRIPEIRNNYAELKDWFQDIFVPENQNEIILRGLL